MAPGTRIGIIGLGAMGEAIAERLLEQGYALTVHDVRPVVVDGLAGPVDFAATPAELAGQCSTILIVLPDDDAVRATLLPPHGLESATAAGHLLINMTTNSPELSRSLAKRFAARDVGFLDVGVLGNPPTARTGKMTLLVGGTDQDLDRARDVLNVLAANVRHLGPSGVGHIAKLAANQLFLAQVAAMGEALAVIEAAGAPVEGFLDALACTGGRGVGLADIGRTMRGPSPSPGFALRLAAKDAGLLAELADSVGQPAHLAGVLRALYGGAATVTPDQDFTGVFEQIRRLRSESSGPPPYLGTFEVSYPGGMLFRSEVPDAATMRWTCLAGPLQGRSGVEQTERRQIRPDLYFVSWYEPDGTLMAQVADYAKMRVQTCMVSEGECTHLEGTLRRLDS